MMNRASERLYISLAIIPLCSLSLALLTAFLDVPTEAQDQHLTVTIMADKTNGTLSDAQILMNRGSNRLFIGGGEAPFWSAPSGLLITDPVIPPEGFQLQPTIVEWRSLKQIDFLSISNYCRVKITMVNGAQRDVFVWNDRWDGSKVPLELYNQSRPN